MRIIIGLRTVVLTHGVCSVVIRDDGGCTLNPLISSLPALSKDGRGA